MFLLLLLSNMNKMLVLRLASSQINLIRGSHGLQYFHIRIS